MVEPPEGINIVKNRWVFALKKNNRGEITRFRARLVAKGFSQKQGEDFFQIYAPVVRNISLRILICIGLKNQWLMEQLDVKSAFLHGLLKEKIYLEQPYGFSDGTNKVCLLYKGLYGLRQAARCWYQRLVEIMEQHNFHAVSGDECLFVNNGSDINCIVAICVDDILILAWNNLILADVKKNLNSNFEIHANGKLGADGRYLLGLQIEVSGDGIKIHQHNLIMDLAKQINMEICRKASTPMEKGIKWLPRTDTEANCDIAKYQMVVGKIMYLASTCRPDVSAPINILAQFSFNPTELHWHGP